MGVTDGSAGWSREAQAAYREYRRRCAGGDDVSFEAYCAEHGHLAEELLRVHEEWQRFQSGNRGRQARHGRRAPRPAVTRRREDTRPRTPPADDGQTVPRGAASQSLFGAANSSRGLPDVSLVPGKRLHVGATIGGFQLLRVLGHGGMGQVWEAEHVKSGQHVALKLVRELSMASETVLAHFRVEAEAAGRLFHPCIVTVKEFGESDGITYIAQELVEGSCALRDALEDLRKRSEVTEGYYRHLAEFFAEIADALQLAHDAGVIHRDIKPENILIAPDDRPKIVDFGLARDASGGTVSQTGDFAATYLYMSPEQAMARRMGIDHRTDIFSLGVTLYESLCFARPFEGDTAHQIAERVLYHVPPEPQAVRSLVPADLSVICMKAIEKRREDRYQTMGEFQEDLARFLDGEPIRARPPSPTRRARRWVKQHPRFSSGIAASIVIFTLMIGLLVTEVRRSRDAEGFNKRLMAAFGIAEENELLAIEKEQEAVEAGKLLSASERAALTKDRRIAELDEKLRALEANMAADVVTDSTVQAQVTALTADLYESLNREYDTYELFRAISPYMLWGRVEMEEAIESSWSELAAIAGARGLGVGAVGGIGRLSKRRVDGVFAGGRRGGEAVTVAVDNALKWLKHHQNLADGHWSCSSFDEECGRQEPSYTEPCDGLGAEKHDVGVTGLAVLAYLGAGHTHKVGKYKQTVEAGLRFLVDVQQRDGNFANEMDGKYTYDHIIATLAMVEAYALTDEYIFKASAEKALEYMYSIRNKTRAWRYADFHSDMAEYTDDMSVTGWAILAMTLAREYDMPYDETALEDSLAFLEEMTDDSGVTGYVERGGGAYREEGIAEDLWPNDESESMTAVGVLCRIFADPKLERPGNKELVDKGAQLIAELPPIWDDNQPGRRDFYFWHWGTYALYQFGGPTWTKWERHLVDAIVEPQEKEGELRGSWDPSVDPWGSYGGRVYSTAMLALTLEVFYRYDTVMGSH